jgi:hypothetical protein
MQAHDNDGMQVHGPNLLGPNAALLMRR